LEETTDDPQPEALEKATDKTRPEALEETTDDPQPEAVEEATDETWPEALEEETDETTTGALDETPPLSNHRRVPSRNPGPLPGAFSSLRSSAPAPNHPPGQGWGPKHHGYPPLRSPHHESRHQSS
jgi:hypothetical protein